MKRLEYDTFISISWGSQKDTAIEEWLLTFIGREDLYFLGVEYFGCWSRTFIHRGCQKTEGRIFRFLNEEDAMAFRLRWM